MPTFREIMEAEERRHREAAEEIARDMKELERIVSKYNLLVIATPEKPLPPMERISRTTYANAAREAESIIRAAGHPVSINELMRMITVERGITLGGREPSGSLSSAMVTGKRLSFIKDIGWWIKDVPWPISQEDLAKLQEEGIDQPKAAVSQPYQGGRRRSPEKQRLFETVRSILRSAGE